MTAIAGVTLRHCVLVRVPVSRMRDKAAMLLDLGKNTKAQLHM